MRCKVDTNCIWTRGVPIPLCKCTYSYIQEIKFSHLMKHNTLLLIFLLLIYKTVVQIESCADSGRCRIIYSDGSTDLLLNPFIGQVIKTSL
jgi:hypothetical protein